MDLTNIKSLLLNFYHGLGDAVQLQILIRHLKEYYPHLKIGVEAKMGIASVFNEMEGVKSYDLRHPFYWRDEYEQHIELSWDKPEMFYEGTPSTKPRRCLEEVFNLEPIEDLFYYEFHPSQKAVDLAERYISEELKNRPFGIIHPYGSRTSNENKNLTENELIDLTNLLLEKDYQVVILDWEPRNPLTKYEGELDVHIPWRAHWLWEGEYFGDAGTIGALIQRAKIFMGVDSGPAHISAATETPSIVFWRGTEPLKCFDLSNNVEHVVFEYCDSMFQDYFKEKYTYSTYMDLEKFTFEMDLL